MKFFSLRALPRVHIVTTNDLIADEWSSALRTAGLSISSSQCLTFPLKSNSLVLLLQPDISLMKQVNEFLHNNQQVIENLYVVSDDAEWVEFSLQFSIPLLNSNTHPLEAARIFNHTKKAVIRTYFARYATYFNF